MNLYYYNGNKISEPLVFVDNFGAIGDGVADDTEAIQAALDSASNGGYIIFTTGIYKITESLLVYSNQTIELNGSTILQGADINNLMRGYVASGVGLYNGSLNITIKNGVFNGGNYTTNNTLLAFCHGHNITIDNCTFKNAYGVWHNLEINSSKHVVIKNCYFEGSRKSHENGCLIQIDSYDNSSTYPWQSGLIDRTISYMVEISGCHFYNDTVSPAIGNHSNTASDYIKIHDCTFEGLTSRRGAINFQSANHLDCYNNTFVDCPKILTISSEGTNVLYFNRIDGSDITVSDGYIKEIHNVVNGIDSDKDNLDDLYNSVNASE